MIAKIGLYRDPRRKKPWVVRWFGEYDPASGKQKRYSESFKLKVEAEEFQANKRKEIGQGTPRDKTQKVTLSGFCKDWLSARKPDLRPASHELYSYTIKRLEAYFGKEACLQDVTPKDAMVFVSKQKSLAQGHEGKELSDWSREQIKRYGKLIFEAAVKWRLIPTNPFDALSFKRPATKRWHKITIAEYHALQEAAPNLRWKVFYALAYTSGARVGELFSLTWNDIDFESGKLIISSREETAAMPPFHVKDHEARRIPLPAHTIDLLTQFQSQAPEGVPYILLDKERYEHVRAKW